MFIEGLRQAVQTMPPHSENNPFTGLTSKYVWCCNTKYIRIYLASFPNKEDCLWITSLQSKVKESSLSFREPKFSLKPLYRKISEEVSKFTNNQPFLLLMDDVSVFLSLGVPVTCVYDFVHYCLVTACAQDKVDMSLVVFAQLQRFMLFMNSWFWKC